MNKKTLLTIGKSVALILILIAFVFALRAPAADLNILPDEVKGEYVDSYGLPYFSEMDSYYNYRLTDNYITTGHVGDEVVNNTEMDTHRYSPESQPINYEMGIVYVTAFMHDVFNAFGSYDVREVAFWTGALISCLAVIPAFIFTRRLTNSYGAVVASLIIVLAPNYFAHTYPGFFDTDMFYFIFALFFIFFFMESLRSRNIILKIVYAVLSTIAIGLFSLSWSGYIFYIGVMGLFAIAYLILCYLLNIGKDDRNEYSSKLSWFVHQKDLISIVLIAVVELIILGVIRGFNGLLSIFGSLESLLSLQSASRAAGGFPNVLISVAEMQKPALVSSGMDAAFVANTNGVINGIGGIIVLFAGLIVLYTLIHKIWKLRSAKVSSEIDNSKKPHKSKRTASATRLDNQYKFKLSLSELQDFGSQSEINKSRRITLMYTTLFVVWTLVAILAVTKGSRFITTLVLPFGIMAGIFVGYAVDYIKDKSISNKWLMAGIVLGSLLGGYPICTINAFAGIVFMVVFIVLGYFSIFKWKTEKTATSNSIPIKKWIAIALVVIALVSPTVCSAYQTSNGVLPGTNDAMWNSLEWINQNTPADTVVTSWWDFGYLFEVAADRQVTFDGGSQTGQRAYWLGKAMMTDNLELSAGIFRMLDTTGDKAVEQLYNYTDDNGKTTNILCEILPMTADNAKKTLTDKYDLTSAEADSVIQYTHPANPRPVIFITSSDMLQKAGWWSYFGSWNFKTQSSENYQYFIPDSQATVGPGQTVKYPILSEGGVTYNIVIERGTNLNDTNAYCEATVDQTGEILKVNGTEYNPLKASHLIIFHNNTIVKDQAIKGVSDGNFTIFLQVNGNKITPILMNNELSHSMFTRLYLEQGVDQDIFTAVHAETGVLLWNVNFNSTVAGGASK